MIVEWWCYGGSISYMENGTAHCTDKISTPNYNIAQGRSLRMFMQGGKNSHTFYSC